MGFAIVAPDTGELAGNIAGALDGATVEISYWLAADARGRGLAPRAVHELSRWFAANWPEAKDAELCIHADNLASQHVALAAGFHHEPCRDGHRMVGHERWPIRWYRRDLS